MIKIEWEGKNDDKVVKIDVRFIEEYEMLYGPFNMSIVNVIMSNKYGFNWRYRRDLTTEEVKRTIERWLRAKCAKRWSHEDPIFKEPGYEILAEPRYDDPSEEKWTELVV